MATGILQENNLVRIIINLTKKCNGKITRFNYQMKNSTGRKHSPAGADAIKKFTPRLGIPYLGV